MIEMDQITKRYGETVAVDRLSFRVAKGEILGLLGPNGAGKTTIMRILTGYLAADDGKINVSGWHLPEQSLEIRRKIGYLPESNPLYPDMGVVDYLSFITSMRGVTRRDRKRRVDEVIKIAGLEKMAHKNIGELSKGYCQRVGLAQAIVHDPDILVLDEPTVGLDPNQIVEIRHLIQRFGREKTVLLSSHILPEVAATCSRIIILNRGRIVGSGTPEEMSVRARGGHAVTFALNAPSEAVITRLKASRPVKNIECLGETGEGIWRFRVITDDDIDIRETIFRMAVDNQWVLTELYRESLSLEEVLQHLTVEEVVP
ncbi:MAG: ATP-binding cassette domain-containing protein [Syntrophales bacterium]